MRPPRLPIIAFCALIAVYLLAAFTYRKGYEAGEASGSAHMRSYNEPLVEKAIALYGHGKMSSEAVRKSNDINVVYLPTMTCVGFNLLPGSVGGDDTVCLDKAGQRIVLTYMDGQ